MMEDTQETLFFDNIRGKHIGADFGGGTVTSDAGVLLLRQAERRCGIIAAMASVLHDRRHRSYVQHPLRRLLAQRIYQIACGYQDGNDSDELRHDPALQCACELLPSAGNALGSQPTMSRLENGLSRSDLYRIGLSFIRTFVSSYPTPPRRIILDIDDTDDAVHGGQQLSLFNAYYGGYCYQPIHLYEGHSGRFITALLRPGKRPCGTEITSVLRHVLKQLRRYWPETLIILRGDSHYSTPEVHEFCEQHGLLYVLGQNVNSRILEQVWLQRDLVAFHYEQSKQPQLSYTDIDYRADSWKQPHRLVVKCTATAKGSDVRAIVTNIPWKDGRRLYERLYCARGRMENCIKDHKSVLHSDRTSCERFAANQARLFLHSAAYVLLHTLRHIGLTGTEYAAAQFDTLQKCFLKIGARVVESSRRLLLHLPSSYPLKQTLRILHHNLLASTN